MSKQGRKTKGDVVFYAPPLKPDAKRRFKIVTWSTTATSIFLGIIHEQNPDLTIIQLYELISDREKFLRNVEALKVLQDHIDKGYGGCVPNWKS